MKKLSERTGLTLVEMLVCTLILALLSVGIVTCMNSATDCYTDSMFRSDSASLEHNLNNILGDMLRYATDVAAGTEEGYPNSAGDMVPGVSAVFTNEEYFKYAHGYFLLETESAAETNGKLKIANLDDPEQQIDAVNNGAYGRSLTVSDFNCEFHPAGGTQESSYFEISYVILSSERPDLSRPVSCSVRVLNGLS